jgi:hypothetical protein
MLVGGYGLCGAHLTRDAHKNEAAATATAPTPWPPLTSAGSVQPLGGPHPMPRYTYSANMYHKRSTLLNLYYSILLLFMRYFYSVGGNFSPCKPPWRYRPLREPQSVISCDSRAQSLHKSWVEILIGGWHMPGNIGDLLHKLTMHWAFWLSKPCHSIHTNSLNTSGNNINLTLQNVYIYTNDE